MTKITIRRATTKDAAAFARIMGDPEVLANLMQLPYPTEELIMRFATPSNLTGHPAISFPAGYTAAGLPIGMQVIGRPWDEQTLLRLALAAEQFVERRQPAVFHNLLPIQ